MVAFDVETPELVDTLHSKVLGLGGTSEGDPGPRGEHLYVGYWRDLDEPFEGVLPNDWHDPPRLFSFRSDSQIRGLVELYFELVEFHVVTDSVSFQSLTLRVPAR